MNLAALAPYPIEEVQLMLTMKPLLKPVLDNFAKSNSVPESFWAGLTANETGVYIIHNLQTPLRFEPVVYLNFKNVLRGVISRYGGLGYLDLKNLSDVAVRSLSSSHGLCQIMGYNAVSLGFTVDELENPDTHYHIAAILMEQFCRIWNLNAQNDFKQMAECWNAGHPNGLTDPIDYAENLILRKNIWEAVN